MADHQSLHHALLAAQRSLEAIEADSRLKTGARYRYTSAEHMIATCRRALHAQGLALMPGEASAARCVTAPVVDTDTGAAAEEIIAIVVDRSWILCYAGSGEKEALSLSTVSDCGRGRPAAKAAAAAHTAALRDLLRDLLLLPKGESPAQQPPPAAPRPAAPSPPCPAAPDPHDPSRAELVEAGWAPDVAVQLCAAGAAKAAPIRPVVQDLHQMILGALGPERTRGVWESVGVTALKTGVTWAQVRRFALLAGRETKDG